MKATLCIHQILKIYVSENSHFFIFEFQICNDALVLKSAAVVCCAEGNSACFLCNQVNRKVLEANAWNRRELGG
jgi:hypothetical protein